MPESRNHIIYDIPISWEFILSSITAMQFRGMGLFFCVLLGVQVLVTLGVAVRWLS